MIEEDIKEYEEFCEECGHPRAVHNQTIYSSLGHVLQEPYTKACKICLDNMANTGRWNGSPCV
ncbi:MAG: hypothetical protein E6L03_10510 [Thaumarchaeota archaeon]|nr:MAG: hypothetical protein E6L03_10510 [Nitrososphaerota archaeon]